MLVTFDNSNGRTNHPSLAFDPVRKIGVKRQIKSFHVAKKGKSKQLTSIRLHREVVLACIVNNYNGKDDEHYMEMGFLNRLNSCGAVFHSDNFELYQREKRSMENV